jgi:SAM-dependent methyltransferase
MTQSNTNLTYGEVTSAGRKEFCNIIKEHLKPTDRFIDVGSGYGKITTEIAETFNIPSIGIEIDQEKHEIARKICWSNRKNLITLIHGDIRKHLDLLKTVNILYADNVTWDKKLTELVFDNFNGVFYAMRLPEKAKQFAKRYDLTVSWFKESKSNIYKINTKDLR